MLVFIKEKNVFFVKIKEKMATMMKAMMSMKKIMEANEFNPGNIIDQLSLTYPKAVSSFCNR